MRLYLFECRRIATSIMYYLFIAILLFSWYKNIRGIAQNEIDMAEGKSIGNDFSFDRPLFTEPTEEDDFFGSKTSEDNPNDIMTGVTRALIMEYMKNSYATYPLGYYKAITLSDKEQKRVLEIISTITGLDEDHIRNLPSNYFPAVTGSIISFDNVNMDSQNQLIISEDEKRAENVSENDKTKRFIAQVTYEQFNTLMQEMEKMIGERGSRYSHKMMIAYFGISEMNYEEAYAEYEKTMQKDQITGGFARLFCDYMGLSLGLYPIFIIAFMWLKDRTANTAEAIYSKQISSVQLVLSRYFASITMILLPILLLSLESLIPLLSFGSRNGYTVDSLAFFKYILWWLLPTVMIVCAIGVFFTLLTDSPLAILLQFIWWFIDKGVTALSGGTKLTTLMVRHNTLRGYELIEDGLFEICMNRMLLIGISSILLVLSVWLLGQKRKGKINVSAIYTRCRENLQGKFLPSYKK